jgi:hypothetical protein
VVVVVGESYGTVEIVGDCGSSIESAVHPAESTVASAVASATVCFIVRHPRRPLGRNLKLSTQSQS